jgi:hypothetical protein
VQSAPMRGQHAGTAGCAVSRSRCAKDIRQLQHRSAASGARYRAVAALSDSASGH